MVRLPEFALPRGPDHYWTVACEFGPDGFTVSDLLRCTNGVSRDAVRNWITAMVADGHLRAIGSRRMRGVYGVVYAVVAPSIRPPVRHEPATAAQQMWTAMRTLDRFTVDELAAAASTEALTVSRRTAKDYVGRLARAGVLVQVGRCGGSSAPKIWRLKPSANTGPRTPRRYRAAFMWDPNAGVALGLPEAQEETR